MPTPAARFETLGSAPAQTGDRAVAQAALALCGMFLACTAVSLVTLERLKYAALAQRGLSPLVLLRQTLAPVDFVLFAVAGLALLAAIIVEWRAQGLRRLLAGERPGWLLVAMVAASLWFCHAMLAPGLLYYGDAGSHVARVSHLAMALRDGSSLFWDNYFFGGGLLLQFTGPVFHWIASLFTLLVGDPTDGIRIAILATRLAAGWLMFRYLRQVGLGLPAAALGGLFYAGSFFFSYLVSIRGTFPQAINLAAMPAILYFSDRVLVGRGAAGKGDGIAVIGLALAAIAMIGNHQPTAMIFAFYAGLHVLVRLWLLGLRPARLLAFVLPVVLVGVGSLYFLIPFALERHTTAEDFSAGALVSLMAPPLAQLGSLVTWGRIGLNSDFATYQGLVLLACAAGGGVLLLGPARRTQPAARMWLLLTGLALLSLFIWGLYVRQNLFTFLFLCGSAAAGAEVLIRSFPSRPIALLIFVGFLLDAGPSAVQPWARSDLRVQERMGVELARRAGTERVLETTGTPDGRVFVSVGPDSSPLHYARLQELRGPHKLDATKAHNFFVAVLQVAQDEMRARHSLGAETRGLLASLNIGWVAGADGPRLGLPADMQATLPDPLLGPYWRIADATPFLTAGRLEVAPRPASFDGAPFWNPQFDAEDPLAIDAKRQAQEIFRRMGVQPGSRQAATLLLPAQPAGAAWAFNGPAPLARLVDYTVEPGRLRLVVASDGAGFIRLAHPLSAFSVVTVDGAAAAPAPDIGSLIVLPLHAGTNDIVVEGVPSRLRQTCLWITMATLAGLLLALPLLAWRRRTTPPS